MAIARVLRSALRILLLHMVSLQRAETSVPGNCRHTM